MDFEFKGFKVRGFELEDGIWFSGNDVAKALGYAIPRKAISDHTFESDRKRLFYKACSKTEQANECSVLWSGNDFSDKTLINESGLYCMIFGSKLETAEEFKIWVTGTVLPSIRQHGGYILDQEYLSAEDTKALYEEIELLNMRAKALKEKNAALQKRRHELIAEVKKTKVKGKKQKKEIKALNECIEIWENMYDSLQDEYDRIKTKVRAVSTDVKTQVESIQSARSYKVDRNGFVIFE